MKIRIYCFTFLIAFTALNSDAKNKKKEKQKRLQCSELADFFHSYQEAYLIIISARFELHQKKLTNSSTVHKIEYFSCDKETGYLLLRYYNDIAMLHQNIPINIWQNIYLQDDPLEYYETNIKCNEKYKMKIVGNPN